MLNLRALYGSRMPQPLHPPTDPEASSYWEHDTAAAQEIARAMAEAQDATAADSEDVETLRKPVAAVLEGGGAAHHVHGVRSSRSLPLSIQLADLLSPPTAGLPALLEPGAGSPPSAQLSPSGLISIAAADIDEAGPGAPRDLDWAFIAALRRRAEGAAPAAGTTRRASEVVAQMTGPAAAEDEAHGPLRFLSLLRRINEIRSQQHVDHETWDGLPYPQILALPTFRYQPREVATTEGAEGLDPESKSLCAVCYTDYEEGEEVRALPCLHFYHRECIDQWLLHHRLCPICKHVVAVY